MAFEGMPRGVGGGVVGGGVYFIFCALEGGRAREGGKERRKEGSKFAFFYKAS
jgi:hypothetical protein